jgi:hypothetical protein
MKTKTLVSLILVCAAWAQAETYTSDWSAFDSGLGQSQSGAVTHAGLLSTWAGESLQSEDYTIEPGPPTLPGAEPASDAPLLTIALVGNNVRVAWPASATGLNLEEATDLNGGIWTTVPGPYQSNGDEQFILAPAVQGDRFYRLRGP